MESILSLLFGNAMSYLAIIFNHIHPTDLCPAFYEYCVSATRQTFNFILSTVWRRYTLNLQRRQVRPKVTQLIRGKALFQAQVCGVKAHALNHNTTLPPFGSLESCHWVPSVTGTWLISTLNPYFWNLKPQEAIIQFQPSCFWAILWKDIGMGI